MIESMDNNEGTAKSRRKTGGTPVLDNFSKDLIKMASEGKLDPVIGRDMEINRIAQILSRRKKNNPIIIGEPGCGKTALVEGLAIKIVNGECPRNLVDKRIVNLDLTSVVAGTKYRGQFEERMKGILDELTVNKDVILFIDELHSIVGAGNSQGNLDASNIFKPALARGEIQCIGATTLDEYRTNFEKDGALERRFQKVVVDSPSKKETLIILNNLRKKYEEYHKVSYSDEVLELCVNLADRYITDREFPDKAFDIMDEVGARAQVEAKVPEVIEKLTSQLREIGEKKKEVVKKQKYEEAAELRNKEKKLAQKLESEKEKYEQEMTDKKREISLELVLDVVSSMTKIPVSKISVDDKTNLIGLDKSLMEKVIGQDDAVTKIAKSIRRNRLGIKDPNKPIGSFIFLGSTGVGKTHLAKQLAKQIFGSEDNLIRVDMSEFQEKHTISKLIGAPPGYVGYDEGGQLTEQVKNKPYSVILFDEVEKANKEIFNTLLQMLDEGHLTDSLGRKINFKNCLIIMTSNLGVKKLQDFGNGIGFNTSSSSSTQEEYKRQILQKEMKNYFSPEFLNRIDEVIVFNSLKQPEIEKIVRIEMDKLITRLAELKLNFVCDESIIQHIAKVGFDESFGARPIKRAIQDEVEDFISEEYLVGNVVENGNYILKYDESIKIEKGS